jgi:hypothetical protein
MIKGNIHILACETELNYFDSQSIFLPRFLTPLEAWNMIMSKPQPLLKMAFKVRDAISSRFGVKRIGGFTERKKDNVTVGEMLDFFVVEYISDKALVLTERDKHLDVMTCVSTDGQTLSITSSVQTHNLFGRAYMIPVGIAHKLIVSYMLKRLKNQTNGTQ